MGLIIPPRLPKWRGLLSNYLIEVDGVAFRPGKHDCALFCAGAVRAMTGFDAAKGWRGYRTLKEGGKRLQQAGYESWWDMIADRECDTSQLNIGDVALVEQDEELAGGICIGSHIAVLAPSGRTSVRLGQSVRAFKI